MFLGYQNELIEGSKIETLFVTFVAETKEELENLPCITLAKIEETDEPVELVNGRYCVGETAINEAKSEEVRSIRNQYLKIYVDPVVSNPLRWGDMTAKEQQRYANYRTYLLDYTELESWYLQNPMTFDEWKVVIENIKTIDSEENI